jgi:hypothetical protein
MGSIDPRCAPAKCSHRVSNAFPPRSVLLTKNMAECETAQIVVSSRTTLGLSQ